MNMTGNFTTNLQIGEAEKVEVKTSQGTITFEVVNDGRVSKWLTITPPSSANVDDIQYEIQDGQLWIRAV